MLIQCNICKKNVESTSCWAVIDTKTRTRYYECKDPCEPPPQPQPQPPQPQPPLEPFELSIVDEEEESIEEQEETTEVQSWASKPKESMISKVLTFFGLQTHEYKRIKQD